MNNTDETLDYWAATMRMADLSERTIRERLIFIRHMDRETSGIWAVTKRELIEWMGSMPWSNSTRVHRRSGLHTFFSWMQEEGLREDNPAYSLPKVKMKPRDPRPFQVDEIEALLASGIYKRTRVMVALYYYLGLRASEIAAVHGQDVDWKRRTLYTVGKGAKEAVQPIPESLWAVIQDMPRDGYWFPNHQANKRFAAGQGHITGQSVSAVLGDAIRRAGLKHKPHDLRAATATEMNRRNVSAFVIQEGMRHAHMDTTNHYLKVDIEQIRAGLEVLPRVHMPERSGRRAA
ncbi:tyrosine-type recombinase/integrase [Arthrobacter woluwensis]|uniref:tyrosine-type recombinase/integrase n=1 Tax=Arthrobacter woluwensis TaxID=156980 RepID=UPI001AAF6E22|nr:tyrosine-type recombinase/integrase [Arthrobacter woluwensis]QTF71772.1 tyrosine-type recombinase/integrase [Arthrobacter woluwensis]